LWLLQQCQGTSGAQIPLYAGERRFQGEPRVLSFCRGVVEVATLERICLLTMSFARKMSELRKLIRKRLKLSDDVQFEMACMGATVGPELSVHFIQRTIWQHQNQKGPLVLHYRHVTS
jgi:hypothetical protein